MKQKSVNEKPSFEERLAELEALTQNLRGGKIPLNEAVTTFERGMKLAQELEKELKQMQIKVEKLLSGTTDLETPPEMGLFEEADE
jgi:exodeoxyribonuclease VII small subunit